MSPQFIDKQFERNDSQEALPVLLSDQPIWYTTCESTELTRARFGRELTLQYLDSDAV